MPCLLSRWLIVIALSASGALAPRMAQAAAPVRAPAPAACSWDQPGRDSYTGDVPGAVDRYTDLAPDVRQRLQARMRAHDYDDVVEISRDGIAGRGAYDTDIRDMHFGTGRVCATVSRARWSESHRERALVYCDGDTCVMVPTVCRNVSRITRTPGGLAGGAPPGDGELLFDPPGAGAPNPMPVGDPLTPSALPGPLAGPPLSPPGLSLVPPALFTPGPTGPPTAVFFPPIGVLPPTSLPFGPPSPPVLPPTVPAVPEPSSWALALAGCAALAAWLRRRRGA